MSAHSGSDRHAVTQAGEESAPPTPRWVKAFGIAAVVLIVLLIVMIVSGHGGPHSPLRHFQSHSGGADASPLTGAHQP